MLEFVFWFATWQDEWSVAGPEGEFASRMWKFKAVVGMERLVMTRGKSIVLSEGVSHSNKTVGPL